MISCAATREASSGLKFDYLIASIPRINSRHPAVIGCKAVQTSSPSLAHFRLAARARDHTDRWKLKLKQQEEEEKHPTQLAPVVPTEFPMPPLQPLRLASASKGEGPAKPLAVVIEDLQHALRALRLPGARAKGQGESGAQV